MFYWRGFVILFLFCFATVEKRALALLLHAGEKYKQTQSVLPDCQKFRKMSEISFRLPTDILEISGTKFWLKTPEISLWPNLARNRPKFGQNWLKIGPILTLFKLAIFNFSLFPRFRIWEVFYELFFLQFVSVDL